MRILVDGGAFSGRTSDAEHEFWSSFFPAFARRVAGSEICLLNRGSGPAPLDGAGVRTFSAPPVDFERSAQEDRRLWRLCRILEADVFLSTCRTSAGIDTPAVFVGWGAPPRRRGPRASSRRAARMAARHLAVGDREAARAAAAHGLPLSLFRVPPAAVTLADAVAEAMDELARRDFVLDESQALRRTAEERATVALAARLREGDERRARWRHRRARWARAARQPRRYLEYLARMLGRAG